MIPRDVKELDEDLAWVEREIARCEDGPRLAPRTPENMKARAERLERLYAMRKRLMRDDAA